MPPQNHERLTGAEADFAIAVHELRQVTGALRIYSAALGESSAHFHGHLVPRFESMPKGARGWAVFDLERAAQAGEVAVDSAEVARIARVFADALARDPPPAP